uniref:Protein FAR1-RELATED SEQUENCE n=1 Tax=Setaria italica TaxID=4555 RepID=K4AMR9_SETIT
MARKRQELKRAVKDSFTPHEFETRWKAVLDKYNARDNNRINYLYNIRSYWVPAFFMDSLYPFSSTTARSESTNAMFKGNVAHKDTIVNFFAAYENIQEKNLSTLDRCIYDSELKTPNQWSYNSLEEHEAKIYTNAIFRKFQVEFKNSTAYGVKELVKEKLFEVKRKTEYSKPDDRGSCRKLDRDGIHCCHVLKIAERLDLLLLPESFVRHRWTKAADHDVPLSTGQQLIIGGSKAGDAVQYCIMMAGRY